MEDSAAPVKERSRVCRHEVYFEEDYSRLEVSVALALIFG